MDVNALFRVPSWGNFLTMFDVVLIIQWNKQKGSVYICKCYLFIKCLLDSVFLCIICDSLISWLQLLLLLPLEFLSGWNRLWQRVTVQSWPAPRLWCQEVGNLSVFWITNYGRRNGTICLQSHFLSVFFIFFKHCSTTVWIVHFIIESFKIMCMCTLQN